uniref:Uncharacterized protein n=1 Tax=Rhizophora mucronata TaxID=61149 RepID=A0A2P2PT66_RHIMU
MKILWSKQSGTDRKFYVAQLN